MIKVAFFDMGETLIHDGRPFPGVAAALATVAGFHTADGALLFLGIVSDYFPPAPPPTEAKIAALEQRYRDEILGPSGLAPFFQPFTRRVTLSTRAGVTKPARKVFATALTRSATGATLAQCLFVTENLDHLAKCAALGMTPVRFGPGPGPMGMAGFAEWVDAPAVIAGLVNPGSPEARAAAVAPALAERHDLLEFTPTEIKGRNVRGEAGRLVQLKDARLGPLDGVFVEIPVEVTFELGPDGRAAGVSATRPDPGALDDAVNYASGLVKSRQVALPGQEPSPLGTSHAIVTDPAGRRRLVRRGFSAR